MTSVNNITNQETVNVDDKFWTETPNILYKKYFEIIPNKQMTKIEQLNSITRLCIYLITIFLVLGKENMWIKIPGILIILIIFYYYMFGKNETFKNEKYLHNNIKIYDNVAKNIDVNGDNFFDVEEYKKNLKNQLKKEKLLKSILNKIDHPTTDNPFVNPLINNLQTEYHPVAGNSDDDEIHNEVTKNFFNKLANDPVNAYQQEVEQRNFYTVPEMDFIKNPNDQDKFAKWLYTDHKTCRTDQSQCPKYDELRSRQLNVE